METENPTVAPAATDDVSVLTASSIKKRINEAKQGCGDKIVERVVDVLTERNVETRTANLITALEKHTALQKEMNSITPDNVQRNADGSVASQTFSDAQYKKFDEAKKKVAQWDEAIKTAVNSNNWDKLDKLLSGK